MSIGKNIKIARERLGLTQAELAHKLGYKSRSSINKIESGENDIPQTKVVEFARALDCTIYDLMGGTTADTAIPAGFEPLPATRMVPLYNAIACGTPIFADSNVETMVPMPENIKADFAVRCKGDSMTGARIMDGDLVFIRKQPTVENGEIAAVLVGEEATLKRFYQYGDTVVLRAENPSFKELTFSGAALDDIQIMGKAVAFLSAVS